MVQQKPGKAALTNHTDDTDVQLISNLTSNSCKLILCKVITQKLELKLIILKKSTGREG